MRNRYAQLSARVSRCTQCYKTLELGASLHTLLQACLPSPDQQMLVADCRALVRWSSFHLTLHWYKSFHEFNDYLQLEQLFHVKSAMHVLLTAHAACDMPTQS